MSTFAALHCSIHKYHHYYEEKNKKQTWYAIVKTLETGSNEYFIFITFSLFKKKNRLVIYCSKKLLERMLIVYINYFSSDFIQLNSNNLI